MGLNLSRRGSHEISEVHLDSQKLTLTLRGSLWLSEAHLDSQWLTLTLRGSLWLSEALLDPQNLDWARLCKRSRVKYPTGFFKLFTIKKLLMETWLCKCFTFQNEKKNLSYGRQAKRNNQHYNFIFLLLPVHLTLEKHINKLFTFSCNRFTYFSNMMLCIN